MKGTMIDYIVIAAVGMLITGLTIAQTWTPYKFYSPPPFNLAVVHVVVKLGTEAETRSECAGAAACYREIRDTHGRLLGTPIIYAQIPQDFNDTRALAYLGHEVLHALGANHD